MKISLTIAFRLSSVDYIELYWRMALEWHQDHLGYSIMTDRFSRIAIILGLILLTLWVGSDYAYLVLAKRITEPRPVAARESLSETEQSATEIFNRISPSVVFIMAQTSGGRFMPFGAPPMEANAGSGFVWDAYGHIVTNNHVIQGSQRIGVRFGTDKLWRAEITGTAPDYDLAVVRIPDIAPDRLSPIPIGRSEDLRVGQITYAIGNPFALSRTMTKGIISALNRTLPTPSRREISGVIQTDASINPGNSGGPLLDSAGRLIGVNTAILSESGTFSGVGFAIPVDAVNRIIPQLIKEGKVPRPGIGIAALPEEVSAHFAVQGVIIAEVIPGSPADKANLKGINPRTAQPGDIITQVNGHPVHSIPELAAQLAKAGIGNQAKLTVQRDGKTRTVTVAVVDISQA